MPLPKIYRRNVAIVVANNHRQLLACRRSDRHQTWQLPQGGIEVGESPKQAMFRELDEEIGTSAVKIIATLPETIRYDWPEHLIYRGYHGQEQYYFLVQINDVNAVSLARASSNEFDFTEWVSADEFLDRVQGFKREVYLQAINKLRTMRPDTI